MKGSLSEGRLEVCVFTLKRFRRYVTSEVNYACIFPLAWEILRNYERLYGRLRDEKGRELGRETREETAKIAHQRSSVREIPRRQIMDILPGRKDYYLRMTAISFAVMCTRRLMTGFFVAKNADFLLLVALLMTLPIFRRIGEATGDKIRPSAVPRSNGSMDRKRLSHARLERLHDWFKTWEFNGDSWVGKGTRLIRSHQFGENFVNRQRMTQDMNNGMLHSWPIAL